MTRLIQAAAARALWCALVITTALACQGGCATLTTAPSLPGEVIPTATATPTTTAEGGSETAPPVECRYLPSRSERSTRNTTRIVGGSFAPEVYPWIAALETRSGWQYCAASAIDDHWLVTAAHCQVLANDVVHIGTNDLSKPAVKMDVVEVRNHYMWAGTTSGHDVAVIRVDETIEHTVPLAAKAATTGTAWSIGWGATCEGCSGSTLLKHVELPVVSRSECRAAYGLVIDDTMLCFGGDGNGDSCQGDSGGPTVIAGALVAITSWGEGCDRPGLPGVNTNVAAVREWIEACAR